MWVYMTENLHGTLGQHEPGRTKIEVQKAYRIGLHVPVNSLMITLSHGGVENCCLLSITAEN